MPRKMRVDVIIPDTIHGLPVTGIGFLGAASLTSISIRNSVSSIELRSCYGYLPSYA